MLLINDHGTRNTKFADTIIRIDELGFAFGFQNDFRTAMTISVIMETIRVLIKRKTQAVGESVTSLRRKLAGRHFKVFTNDSIKIEIVV